MTPEERIEIAEGYIAAIKEDMLADDMSADDREMAFNELDFHYFDLQSATAELNHQSERL